MKNSKIYTPENKYIPVMLLVILAILAGWSAINPFNWQVWITEFITSLLVIVPLCFLYKKFRFSNTGYFIAFFWCVLQLIGAHYSFERVPFDFVTNTFGFERNNYDRLAHFSIGLVSFLIAELVWKNKLVSSVTVAVVFGVVSVMAIACFWELIEWIYAEVDGGEAGAAFLGSQGDIWDAQKDMLMDTIGGVIGGALFWLQNRKSK